MHSNYMINPRVDIAFKKIFGVEQNQDILISLLNAIVSEEDEIDEIELLNPYNERNFKRDKLSILDIKARNKHTGVRFLIEMQLADEMDYHKRGLYSWARVYSSQLDSGNPYKQLDRTIAIHILNFTFIDYEAEPGWVISAPNKYHHRFVLCDKETRIEVFRDIEIHTIELSKFEGAQAQDLEHTLPKIKDKLDQWVTVLTQYNLLDREALPNEIDIPEIKKALHVMEVMQMSRGEREIYEAHLDFLRVESSALEKRFLEGREEGKWEGKLETAKSMLSDGEPIQKIMRYTGLSTEEIQRLRGV